jgi:hypothetical protein
MLILGSQTAGGQLELSGASSTRRNAGNEAMKVLKTHLPKVINELLLEQTALCHKQTLFAGGMSGPRNQLMR